MRMKAGEDDVALDPERPDPRLDVGSEPAVPRENEADFRKPGEDPWKGLEAFKVPLARFEDSKHKDDGGAGIVWPEVKHIAPVFGNGRIAEARQFEAGRHDVVALRCADACFDAQIPHSRTDVDEGVRHPLDRLLRRQVRVSLEPADVYEGHDVHAVYQHGHACRPRSQTPKDARLAGMRVDDVGPVTAEGSYQVAEGSHVAERRDRLHEAAQLDDLHARIQR